MVDGSIKHDQTEGSIHVAAAILSAESCNGWTLALQPERDSCTH